MDAVVPEFDFAYDPGDIRYGRGCVAGLEPADFPAVAEHTLTDRGMENGPPGFDPIRERIEAAPDDAW